MQCNTKQQLASPPSPLELANIAWGVGTSLVANPPKKSDLGNKYLQSVQQK